METFKKILWNILKYSIVLVLNIPVIVYIIGTFIEVGQSLEHWYM